MSGDQVEIITSDIAKPEKEWLSFVRTSKAKEAIKDALKTETTNRIQKGMEILDSKLKELNVTPNPEVLKKLLLAFDLLNKDELYAGIELGTINLDNLKKIVKKNAPKNVIKYWELRLIGSKKESKDAQEATEKIDASVPFLLRENVDNAEQSYEIASCCNPIPGDEVLGYRSPEGAIVIHKPKCPVAIRIMSNEGNRIIAVKWAIHKLVSFLARISMTGIDRLGLVNEITNIISSELKVNMTNINISVKDGIFNGTIDIYVHHTKDLNNLILKISNIKGIESVKRVEDFSTEPNN
jgi:GTP pyrophosphokinase